VADGGARNGTRDVAFIALGSNVGDRHGYLARARAALATLPESRVLAATAPEDTAPVGPVPQGTFVNQMVALETTLAPIDLLDRLLEIERAAGRERTVRWGPRTLDLDIVLLAQQTVAHPRLTVPHPELPNRDWWQRELAELHALLAAREGASRAERVPGASA
jgi:2-amino-4-hydroxy-6-hydroxymethyldihydropteridine diphosphokinase